jgi:hypothetical protein
LRKHASSYEMFSAVKFEKEDSEFCSGIIKKKSNSDGARKILKKYIAKT